MPGLLLWCVSGLFLMCQVGMEKNAFFQCFKPIPNSFLISVNGYFAVLFQQQATRSSDEVLGALKDVLFERYVYIWIKIMFDDGNIF